MQGKPVGSAIEEMEAYQWDTVHDHILLEYLDQHMSVLPHRLVELRVIDKVPDPLPVFVTHT